MTFVNSVVSAKSAIRTNTDLDPKNLLSQVIAYDVATLPWGNGYRYFLQITDMFSKWIELVPMGNQTSQRIVEAV